MKRLAFLLALPLQAELLRVDQRFGGIECLSCVEAIAKGVKRLRGVESVEVDTKNNSIRIALRPGNRVQLGAIRDAVKATGYTPGDARIEAKGRIEPPRLLIGAESFELTPADAPAGDAEVEGEVPASSAGQPLRLRVRRVRVVTPLAP